VTNREELRDRRARSGERIDAKIERVRQVAGERFARLELNVLVFGTEVGDRRRGAEKLAEAYRTEPEPILATPHFPAGTPEEIAAGLVDRRRRWGLNYPEIQQQPLRDRAPAVEPLAAASQHFLAGAAEEIAADLGERRRRWGFNYPVIQQRSLRDFAPVVELVAG